MADSMCGPSNALQSFQKHSTVDRTLQQDRLVTRQSPSHGFRSSPGPNAGLVEHEFEAFQAGQLPLDNGFQSQHSFSPPHLQSAQQAGPSNWASDFHRMNISSPQSQMSQNSFGPQIQQRQDAGWHQEFARQNQGGMDQRIIQPSYQNYAPMSNMMGSQMGGFAGPQMGMSMAQQKQPEEAFDEEAFARAFEEAANAEASRQEVQVEATLQDTTQGVEMGQDIMINESAENLMASDELRDQARIGADSIYDPVSDETRKGQDDPDALARTAGHLLSSIRHEQSSKFQNSQFLELMRQFRDGQMVVDGDQVVEKNTEVPGPKDSSKVMMMKENIAYLTRELRKILLAPSDLSSVHSPRKVRRLLHLLIRIRPVFLNAVGDTVLQTANVELARLMLFVTRRPQFKHLSSLRDLTESICKAWQLDLVSSMEKASEALFDDRALHSSEKEEDISKAYIASQLSQNPDTRRQGLENLLGYGLHPRLPTESGTSQISKSQPENRDGEENEKATKAEMRAHRQRVDDILGPGVATVIEIVRRRGLLCEEMGVEAMERLVSLWEGNAEDVNLARGLEEGGAIGSSNMGAGVRTPDGRWRFACNVLQEERRVLKLLGDAWSEEIAQLDLDDQTWEAVDHVRGKEGERQSPNARKVRTISEGRERYPLPGEEGWGVKK